MKTKHKPDNPTVVQNLQVNIALLRTTFRYTVTELATACGVSVPTMRRYMEDPSRMSVQQLCSLSKFTRIPINVLTGSPIIEGRAVNS